ncbi:hypothetical protein GCM10010271_64580 [Streptomyces kurssanovii]|nr:hypothetical protein GCM10010271_64580 [Streptomyces kurssanovii]
MSERLGAPDWAEGAKDRRHARPARFSAGAIPVGPRLSDKSPAPTRPKTIRDAGRHNPSGQHI